MRWYLFVPYATCMPRSEVTPQLRAIGDQIRDMRERLDLTQGELAAKAGVSLDRVGDIEVGHRASRRTYLRLAEALGLSVEQMDELTSGEARVA